VTVELRDLAFAYGRATVLDGVTASARAGAVTAVIGPNAAGKSTLLRCATGALRPRRGTVRIDGRPPHHLRGQALAASVAYVAQRPLVSAAFTVREVVELGRYALPPSRRRVEEAIERLALSDLADRPYPALSVGQQQRVALARAVAQVEPGACLVLDEPTAAMDLRHAADAFSLLRELSGRGATVILALHDLPSAMHVAEDAWLLDGGRLVAAGPAASVCTADALGRVFGVPFHAWTGLGGRAILLPDPAPAARG
jgi:iron complex transport system ATP-binding protein